MKRRWWIAVILVAGAVLVALELRGRGAVRAAEVKVLHGVHAEVLLTPARAASLGPIGTEFDVTPDGHFVMRSGDALLELVRSDGDMTATPLVASRAPDAFTLDGGTDLLTIRGRYFGQLEDDGSISEALPLPVRGMRLAPSNRKGSVFIFGGDDDIVARRVYRVSEDGGLDVIAELPDRIVAVADGTQSTYVATERDVWRVAETSITLAWRFANDDPPIRAIAIAPDERVLFISTATRTYAVHGPLAIALVRDAGGALRLRGTTLYVWDWQRKLLVSMDHAEEALLQ